MVSRLLGVAAIVIGLAVAWFSILQPLEAARAHVPEVEYSIKSFVFAPLAFTAGLALILGGDRVLAAFSGPPKGREQMTITIAVMALAFATTGLGWWWFKTQMVMLGYGP